MIKRNSSIELLRIICICMVIIQHVCEDSMLGGISIAKYSNFFSSYIFLKIVYCFSRVAVNIFILISGYFSIRSYKRPVGKMINLFFMVSGYGLLTYLGRVGIGMRDFKLVDFIISIFPKNYYVSLFTVLYLVSPYINVLIERLSKKAYRQLITLLFLVFSIWSTLINAFLGITNFEWTGVFSVTVDSSGRGFSIVNFILLYIIGGYMRIYIEDTKRLTKKISLFVVIILGLITSFISIAIFPISEAFLNYDSFLVIIQSICMFSFFINIDTYYNKFINSLANRVFGIFLLHYMVIKAIARIVHVEKAFSNGLLSTIFCLILIVLFGLIISAGIDAVFHFLLNPINNRWKTTKLYNICLSNKLLKESV